MHEGVDKQPKTMTLKGVTVEKQSFWRDFKRNLAGFGSQDLLAGFCSVGFSKENIFKI